MTRILLPRPAGSDADAVLLERHGVHVVADPYIEIMPILSEEAMAERRRLASLLPASALAITSSRALAAFIDFCEVDRSTTVYAIGEASANACRNAGFTDVRVPEDGANNESLLRLVASQRPDSIVVPRSSAAPAALLEQVAALGITVHHAQLYTTTTVQHRPASADALIAGDFDAVIVRSGSAARALHEFVPVWPKQTRVAAAGEPTAGALRDVGIPVTAISTHPDSATVVDTTLRMLGGTP